MKSKTLLVISITLLLLLVCRAARIAPEPKLSDVAEGYKKLNLLTEKPYRVSSVFATLCSPVDPNIVKKRFGPHAFTNINIYMNKLALDGFKSLLVYPIGSVIVKEKMPDRDNKDAAIYLGGMVRRTISENLNVDDWEFFYVKAGEKPVSDPVKMQSCRDCHANAKMKRFVFGNWIDLQNMKLTEPPVDSNKK